MSIGWQLKKALEVAEPGLEKVLEALLKNPNTRLDTQPIIDITHNGLDEKDHQVVTIYLRDKYAQFYDEFTQTAPSDPELKPLVEHLLTNGYRVNLD